MTQQEIIAGNRAIAEFEGRSFSMSHISDYKRSDDTHLPKMRYHRDWNWLMSAWLKIKGLTCSNMDSRDDRVIFRQTIGIIQLKIGDGDIEKAWTAISRFARWYNSLQQQTQKQ